MAVLDSHDINKAGAEGEDDFRKCFSPENQVQKLTEKKKTAPLYLQIYEDICAKVEDHRLKPGDHLPTEQQMVDFYGVSRVTVRKALMELITDGIVKREHSKSATIAAKKPKRNVSRLTSLRSEIINAGMVPTSLVTAIQRTAASGTLAATLNVPEGEPLIYFHRIRYGNGIPVAVQDVHIREKFCSVAELKNLGNGSLYDILEGKRGITIDYADQILSAKIPTRKQCLELDTTNEAPVIYMKRVAYLSTGEVLEYAETYYVTSRYEWTARSYRDSRERGGQVPEGQE